MKKKMIGIIVCMLLITTVLPVAGAIDTNQTDKEPVSSNSSGGDWPMYRCDAACTGFSSSETPDNKKISWQINKKEQRYGAPVIVGDKIYVANSLANDDSSTIYCRDANNGRFKWEDGSRKPCSYPVVYEGKVYITNRYYIECLDAENGNRVWSYFLGDWNMDIGNPVIVNDKLYININYRLYHDDNRFKVFCIDAEGNSDGTTNLLWKFVVTDEDMHGSSPVAVANGKVFVTLKGDLYCLNAETGNEIWRFDNGYPDSTPAVYNGNVYFGAIQRDPALGIIYCLNAENGNVKWSYEIKCDWTINIGSPAVAYDKVYIGGWFEQSVGNCLYCLDANGNGDGTTNKIWETNKVGQGNPAVADGKVYLGRGKTFYCFDAESGEEKWSHTLRNKKDAWFGKPAVANEKVFVSYQYTKTVFRPWHNSGFFNFEEIIIGGIIAFGKSGSSKTRNTIDNGFLDNFPLLARLLSLPIFKNL